MNSLTLRLFQSFLYDMVRFIHPHPQHISKELYPERFEPAFGGQQDVSSHFFLFPVSCPRTHGDLSYLVVNFSKTDSLDEGLETF